LALIGDGRRSATAVTSGTTIIFKVERDSYRRILERVHAQELDDVVNFLQSIVFFETWTADELRRLASCTTRRRYERNATIICQGTHSEQFFFLLTGRCRVIKRLHMPSEHMQLLGALSQVEGADTARLRNDHSPGARRRTRPQRGAAGEAAVASGSTAVAADMADATPTPRPTDPESQPVGGTSAEAGGPAAAGSSESVGGGTMLEIAEVGPFEFFGELALLQKVRVTER
jgi:CRP-like cAMP-binding protein